MNKRPLLIFLIVLSIMFSSITTYATTMPTVSVENTTVTVGEEIKVPVKLSNNTGICGLTISVTYNDNLNLKSIETGDALTSLSYTKPGTISDNPIKLSFIGLEEDYTNGIIAYLNFEPIGSQGNYDVNITYEDGDVVDGNLEAVDLMVENGTIIVTSGSSTPGEDNDDTDIDSHDGPIISIGKASAGSAETIDVPVYISQNSGICGATIKLSYDSALILEGITRGDALESLDYTKPGNLADNPIKISFIGIEEDNTEGLFFTLSFKTPENNGTYSISATYDDGDIVDGDLVPINTLIKNGYIKVGNDNVKVTIGDNTLYLPTITATDGTIYIAFYTNENRMTSVKTYPINSTEIVLSPDTSADYLKIFCWTSNLVPLCEAQRTTLK